MSNAVSEKSLVVLNYLKEHQGEQMTAADIAEALGMEKKSVDGIVTSGLQRKGLTERIPASIELESGEIKAIKFIQVTEAGAAYDHAAAQAQDAAEAAAKAKTDAE
jgi:DNA-binding MarR family transcriptional regulator